MHELYEDDELKIAARYRKSASSTGIVLLSFTGVGHGLGGIDVQRPEFYGAGRTFDNIIFIADKKRSWGNSFSFEAIREVIKPLVAGRTINTIGNSMGGYLAIVASHFFRVDRCIAFAPQFSMNPEIVPWEDRWSKYTSLIGNYVLKDAGAYINDETEYYILSAGDSYEIKHARLFPVRSNVKHYLFKEADHSVAILLKEKGHLNDVITACLNGLQFPQLDVSIQQLSPSP